MTGLNGKQNNQSNKSTNSIVILFDSTCNLNELLEILQNKQTVVITFDYDSHKILLNNKIQHQVSDSYIKEDELQIIQKTSYELLKWCHQPTIASLLEYQGVNTGQLFNVEFHYMLIPFLKKFVELTNVFKVYGNAHYVASSVLYDILYSFTNSVTRFKRNDNNSNQFLYDSIKVSFNIGKNSFSIRIPRSYYLAIKKISEKILHVLLNPKKNSNDNGSVLLVEFDTIRYKKIFSMSTNTPLHLISFCRRRPAIWNLKSFSIMKQSNCTIASYYALDDYKLRTATEIGLSQITTKINSLWNQEEFFKSFFSISGISFWEILKPYFMKLSKKRILEAVKEIEITKRLFEKYKIKSVLIWTENGFNEQIAMQVAKKFNIPVILIQHGGIAYDTLDAYDYNCFAGILPIYSNKFIVWGDVIKNYAINCGIPGEKIEVLGSPIYDEIFSRKSDITSTKKELILLTTSSHIQNFVNNHTVKTREKYEQAIKKICQTVSKMNKKLVIKLHPFQEEIDITKVAKEVDPKITVFKKGDIFPLIESCEVLVTIDVSSTILEAQMFERPTISISVKDFGFGNPEVFTSNSCIVTDMDNFENLLHRTLHDDNLRKQLVENGNRFVKASLSNQGTATEKLLLFLKKYH